MNLLLNHFNELGAAYDLTFSSKALLRDVVIGLDVIKRKLLVIGFNENNVFNHHLIEIKDIQSCFIKKEYGTIKSGELKKRPLERYLERLTLCCVLKSKHRPVEITFFHHLYKPGCRVSEIEKKAKDWESIISQMVSRQLKVQA